jgi:pimeloyl-ACP methyl ester carboxylesterase
MSAPLPPSPVARPDLRGYGASDKPPGDPDRRAAIYLRYGLEIVGPPPAP